MWGNLAEDTGYWVDGEPDFVWSKGIPPSSLKEQVRQALDANVINLDATAHAHAINLVAISIPHALSLAHSLAHYHTQSNSLARDLAKSLPPVSHLMLELDSYLDRSPKRTHNFGPLRDGAQRLVSAILGLFTLSSLQRQPERHELVAILTKVLELYVILYLLQERFGGNLPVYEGILIVKERK